MGGDGILFGQVVWGLWLKWWGYAMVGGLGQAPSCQATHDEAKAMPLDC